MKKRSKALPELRKIVTPEQHLAVVEAAVADNDNMTFPTHAVMKDGEIAGGWCLGGVPLALCWHDTKTMDGRDSHHINGIVDGIMNDRGANMYMMACNSESPFYIHMARFGFQPVWPTNIFYKRTD